MKNKELESEKEQEPFIPSVAFIGSKNGYVFKKDDKAILQCYECRP